MANHTEGLLHSEESCNCLRPEMWSRGRGGKSCPEREGVEWNKRIWGQTLTREEFLKRDEEEEKKCVQMLLPRWHTWSSSE